MKHLVVSALLLGAVGITGAAAQTPAQTPARTSRLYVGAHLSVQTGQPFNSYSNARLGPALTVGAQLQPRLALQLSTACTWQQGTYHNTYTAGGQPVVEDYDTHRQTFTIPILVRATLNKAASRWHVDALAGPTLLVYATSQDYLQTVQGRVTRSGTSHDISTSTTLTLGPSVRATLTPRLEIVGDALANLYLNGLVYGAPISSQLSSHFLAGLHYRFGQLGQ